MTYRFALTTSGRITPWVRWLGLGGLVPQVALAAFAAGGGSAGAIARNLALFYAALILSFVGGAWWGLISRSTIPVRRTIWLVAIAPSLIAFATIAAGMFARSPGPALFVVGTTLVATIAFDYRLSANGLCPRGWLRLRIPLSFGLGGLTLASALVG